MAARASPLNPALRFVEPDTGLLTTEGFRFLQAIRQAAVASQNQTGFDGTVVTGTAGSAGDFGTWNVDGDLVGLSPAASLSAIGAQPLDADLTAWAAVNPSAYLNTAGIAAAYQQLDATLTALAVSDFGTSAPVTKTADFTVAATENFLICNKAAATCTVTLPAAASFTGRMITIKQLQAFTVVSATSNVVALAGGAAAAAILSGAAKWATVVSDGTNWIIMAGN